MADGMRDLVPINDLAQGEEIRLDVFGNPSDAEYFDTVALAVSLMHDALKTFGKKLDGLADSWEIGLKARGVTIEEIPLATAVFVGGMCGPEFPTPGQFADWIIAQRHWTVSQDDLQAIARQARRESDERAEAFKVRMVEKYGDCSKETVQRHLTSIADRVLSSVQLSKAGKRKPPVPAEVLRELEESKTRRASGDPYRQVDAQPKNLK